MKNVYLDRHFRPLAIDIPQPGDTCHDPVMGVCRRLTPRRLCLAAERLGKDSPAFTSLLDAINEVATPDGSYDGCSLDSWYGLVGLTPPHPDRRLEWTTCPDCGKNHFALNEHGRLFDDGLCGECATQNFALQC